MKNKEVSEQIRLLSPILLVGASGFVGSYVSRSLKDKVKDLFTPGRNEADITDIESIQEFVIKHSTQIIINFAAHTDLAQAEEQRGDRKSETWCVNVEGVRNLTEVCRENNIFLVHISTDAVFPGTDEFPGPYPETATPPDNLKPLSWYGYTKLKGELALTHSEARRALIRISYPFGDRTSQKDFLNKTAEYIRKGIPLYFDQEFTPTYLPDLANIIAKIALKQSMGIYHVATHPTTTPHEFGKYLAQKLFIGKKVKKSSVDKYLKALNSVLRPIHGGLSTSESEKHFSIRFHSWKDAIDELTH